MQITVKEAKLLKSGSNNKGEWKLFKVVASDGVEYTTFDTKAGHLAQGAVIEIGDITLKDGDKRSFKELTIISEGATKPAPNGSALTNEQWAEKQRIERDSIEAQVAVKSILSLPIGSEGNEDIARVYNKALKWCESRIDKALETKTQDHQRVKSSPLVKPEATETIDPTTFKNVGELLVACSKKGVSRQQFMEKVGCTEKDFPKINLVEAWEQVFGG